MAKKRDNTPKMISTDKVVTENRKTRHDYAIQDTFEAGIILKGTEVKSLRLGLCNIKESHVATKDGAIWIFNMNIPEYQQASPKMQHAPQAPRKLLLHKREIDKLLGAVTREGMTLVANKIYFDKNGRVKLEIALAKGKKLHDKRETEKNRDWSKQKQRMLREKH